MIKAKPWKGNDLKGVWDVSLKLDGVRAIWNSEQWLSRGGKPLYNLPIPMEGQATDVEVFTGSFKRTIQATRTRVAEPILQDCLYSLDPLDERLRSWNQGNACDPCTDPTAEDIINMMKVACEIYHYEGLVLRQGNVWLKVKPEETVDVPITEVIEGKGKYVGMMGALLTPKGKVGTGFTDEERKQKWNVGDIIEVSCMQFTPDDKFRHPRFIRFRDDKTPPPIQ